MKTCNKCKIEFDLSFFYTYSRNGRPYPYCKKCCHIICSARDKEKTKNYNRAKYLQNKDEYNKISSAHYYANRDRYIKMAVDRERIRKLEDPKYAFTRRLRDRIRKSFKRLSINGKVKSCKEYGIDFEEIYAYVGERPSKDFELDHIIPLNVFDLDVPSQVKLANSKYNLRWISGSDNRKKHTTIPEEAYIDEHLRAILIEIGLIKSQ